MNIPFFKYQGAGNDFIIIDNRELFFPKENNEIIEKLCDRRFGIGADGLILLEKSTVADFNMVYFNSDGNESTMCGNGGRCIVAFANKIGLIDTETKFNAIDGIHNAKIFENRIHLEMIDVSSIYNYKTHTFLNTGSPHHVEFTDNVNNINVKKKGTEIRNSELYGTEGTNVNFVEKVSENEFNIRTYERGVENETLACGTGVTAAALAAHYLGKTSQDKVTLHTKGGDIEVSFTRDSNGYKNIFLIGPAEFVFKGKIDI